MSMTRSSLTLALMLPIAGVSCLHAQTAANTLTWHNNNSRTGANLAETTLTLSNVNSGSFGKTNFLKTDGIVDAEPLYVAQLKVKGATHNVIFIASEHDTVYADDADTGANLWTTSLLHGQTTSSDHGGCTAIAPQMGITATPVIDLTKGPNGAIYVVYQTADSAGNDHHWIDALDITTGGELFGGANEIKASYPGSGDNSVNSLIGFAPSKYSERVALTEWNGAIYTAWTSHCDSRPYTGWIMGYSATTLKQTTVVNLTPNGNDGAIWMGAAGIATTPTKMFLLDGNGTFDTGLDASGFPDKGDFGNAFVSLDLGSKNQLVVRDYYATDNTVAQSAADTDLGSGGVVVLPTLTDNSGNQHWLAVGAGKDHNIYVVDRSNMGRYHPNGGYIYQVLSNVLPGGEYAAPVYFNNKLYYGGVSDYLRAFSFSDAKLGTTPSSVGTQEFVYPGTMPSISANGNANGIIWGLSHAKPAVLYAFDAADLTKELYNSNQAGTRDQFGEVDKFVSMTIANGRVYVPSDTGVAVFGLR